MNVLTNSMNRLTKMLTNTDTKLKEYGVEPYGQKELTDREQRERIKNLTRGELFDLINQYGEKPVNDWLNRYWEENNG